MDQQYKYSACCLQTTYMQQYYGRTHPSPVQLVQSTVDPLLHVQPPLQLLPVVFDGDPGLSPLQALTRGPMTATDLTDPPPHPLSCHQDQDQNH